MATVLKVLRGDEWIEPLRNCLAQAPADTAAWMVRHTRLLKSDTHSRVGLLEIQGQPCFLKLYLAKSRRQQLGFRLGYARALHSFDMAGKLAQRGLAVPVPRACVLVPEGVLLLTEGIADSRNLRDLWLEQPDPERAELLMRCAGAALAALHRAGFAHGDGKWSNLLWSGEQFLLVDLDAVRELKAAGGAAPVPLPRQLRDLARFTVDAEELGASQEQYDFFLNSYCAAGKQASDLLVKGIQSAADSIRSRHTRNHGKVHKRLC